MQTLPRKAIRNFHRKLHDWYARFGRHDLPWRNTCDAYAIYISEVMLQQTQVQTVLARFYAPFLTRFPDLQSLADAPREEVMKHWEGLGYYTRAANLHKAAQAAAPQLPHDVEALQALPGIGRNTAHAIAAFAYRQPVAVMEANVKRVLCRIFALENPAPAALWDYAEQLLDAENPFDYNQAMMDIGAMVCTRNAPDCKSCAANSLCKGKATPQAYPRKQQKKPVPTRRARIIVWHARNGAIHLIRREGAFLTGLYGFAEYPEHAATVCLHNRAYHLPEQGEKLGHVTQTYSHFRMEGEVWRIAVDEEEEGENWVNVAQIPQLPLAGIDHKIIKLCGFANVEV